MAQAQRDGDQMAPAGEDPISLAGVGFVLLSAAGFSLQGVFARWAYAAGASTVTVGLGRFILTAAVLWVYVLWRARAGTFSLKLTRRTALTLLALGAVGYFLGSLTYLGAVVYIPVSLAGFLLYTYPAIATALAVWLGHERVGGTLLLGLLVTLAGVSLVVGLPALMAARTADPRGIALILASATMYASYIVAGERGIRGVHSALAMTYIATGALISFAVLTLITRSFTPAIGLRGWGAIAGIAMITTVLAAGTFLAGLRRLGPARAATISTVEPLFTIVFASAFLGENLSVAQLGGGLVILLGVLLVLQERRAAAEI